MRTFYKIDKHIHYEEIETLIQQPKIIRVTDFDEEDLTEFEEELDLAHQTKQPVIPIVIDSFGGNSYGMLGMIAAIESCKLPVATIITSKAMSAGSVLFCFGTENYRFMHPDAQMMIHDVGGCTSGSVEDIKVDAKHLDYLNNLVYKKVSQHLGHDADYLTNLLERQKNSDWFLSAKDAKKHNIANHLRIPSFEVKLNLSVKFN